MPQCPALAVPGAPPHPRKARTPEGPSARRRPTANSQGRRTAPLHACSRAATLTHPRPAQPLAQRLVRFAGCLAPSALCPLPPAICPLPSVLCPAPPAYPCSLLRSPCLPSPRRQLPSPLPHLLPHLHRYLPWALFLFPLPLTSPCERRGPTKQVARRRKRHRAAMQRGRRERGGAGRGEEREGGRA